MKNKFKDYSRNVSEIFDLSKTMESYSMLYFIFGKKRVFQIPFDIKTPKEISREISLFFKKFLELNTKFKLYYYETKVGKNVHYLLSKEKINIPVAISSLELGLLLGIPKCCSEKYFSEDSGNGYSINSSKRYLKQAKDQRIKKDQFGISVDNDSGGSWYEFVPCSPKCKKALLLKKEIEKNYRRYFIEINK